MHSIPFINSNINYYLISRYHFLKVDCSKTCSAIYTFDCMASLLQYIFMFTLFLYDYITYIKYMSTGTFAVFLTVTTYFILHLISLEINKIGKVKRVKIVCSCLAMTDSFELSTLFHPSGEERAERSSLCWPQLQGVPVVQSSF